MTSSLHVINSEEHGRGPFQDIRSAFKWSG